MAQKPRWTNDEVALIIFHRSRGISLAGCKALLQLKFPCLHETPRSIDAVSIKLQQLSHDPQLYNADTKQWFQVAVDAYIANLNTSDLDSIIHVGPEEEAVISAVGPQSTLLHPRLTFVSQS